ncbi:sulfatase [Novipirellula artificiosorum]|uniref:Arylsulfatase n=1 Tax=Novipirellula artificiosorum TaxID=2528016 RepID=A0A5C6D9N9_9BACT|nr:sulfatase [Novipirellula artificiosorum]TWU32471.1 Arylsulfatase [Novipirellula artificiosorum]
MKRFHLAATMLLCLVFASSTHARSPNFILILTDDHGWSQMSESMDPEVADARSLYLETPNMVRLMREGMRFTSGYSPAPLCTPTRRSILCGTSTARSGPEFKSQWIPKDHATIPKSLKESNANYRCAHFGKWGENMVSTPEECGYDRSDGMTGNKTGGMPSSLGVVGSHDDGPPHFIDNEDPKRTSSITTRAIEFMDDQVKADLPFFVQVSYYAQHLSVVTSAKTLEKYGAKGVPDRRYPPAWAAMLDELDAGVGRLVDTVTKLGIEKNTYIFFTADNGGRGSIPGGDDELPPTNLPLTGAKHSLYEGGIRVPFVARGPNIPAGSVCRVPVVGYDFLPTFLDLAGGDVSRLSDEIDGVSIRKLLVRSNKSSLARPSGAIFFHRPDKLFSAIRTNEQKLMLFWKRNGEVDRHELFDLASNPTEEGNDVSGEQADRAAALQEKLQGYLRSVDAGKPKQVVQKKRSAPGITPTNQIAPDLNR